YARSHIRPSSTHSWIGCCAVRASSMWRYAASSPTAGWPVRRVMRTCATIGSRYWPTAAPRRAPNCMTRRWPICARWPTLPAVTICWRGCARDAPRRCRIQPLSLRQRLLQVFEQVIDVLDAERQAHHAFGDARFGQFVGVELPVRGGRGVGGQRLGVADVYQAREQVQRIQEARPGLAGIVALDAERQDA